MTTCCCCAKIHLTTIAAFDDNIFPPYMTKIVIICESCRLFCRRFFQYGDTSSCALSSVVQLNKPAKKLASNWRRMFELSQMY